MLNFLKTLFFFIGFLVFATPHIIAQCTPPSAPTCPESNVLCGLDEINGYTCSNDPVQNPGDYPCGQNPGDLCPGQGPFVPNNTSWWAFVTNGGNVSITITFSGCRDNRGVQMGIWGDCNCSDKIVCNPNCAISSGSFTISAFLTPCKIYYLMVDGCAGDVCTFTLATIGGNSPTLSPLGKINNDPDMIIDLCEGYCNKEFFVDPQPGGCTPEYVWTLDGTELGENSNRITLDWPVEGDFQLCVTAVIGNPVSGSICDQEGPQCMTVRVRKLPDAIGPPRIICFEQAPFRWQCETVTGTGEYRCPFMDRNCCVYDSVVFFTVLDKPIPGEKYFIGCTPGEVFIDPITKKLYPGCNNGVDVFLSKATTPYKCDTNYLLWTVYPEFVPQWKIACIGAMVEISPNLQNRTRSCGGGETYSLEYAWYKKSDPRKSIISTDERLLVDLGGEYCVIVTITTNLGTETKLCTRDFCEPFNENDLLPKKVPIKGDLRVCIGKTGIYFIDTFIREKVIFYNWSVQGGIIISRNPFDTSAIEVLWNGPPGQTGEVCLWYETDCGRSPETCILVTLEPSPDPEAGINDTLCALNTNLNATPDVGGSWRQLTGPGQSSFGNKNDPKTSLNVNKQGAYSYVWTENRLGCVAEDTVTMIFNTIPRKLPESFICDGSNVKFRVRFEIQDGSPPYKISKGSGSIDVNNIYTSDFINNLTNDTIIISDVYGCRFTHIVNHECKCTNAIGRINTSPIILCEGDDFVFDYDTAGEILDQGDTLIFFIYTDPQNILGSIVQFLNGFQISYDPKFIFDQNYYVGAILGRSDKKGFVDFNLGCVRNAGGKPFVYHKNPTPFAGLDAAVCATEFTLDGLQSIQNSVLSWQLINGSGAFIETPSADNSKVTVSNFGTFTFEFKEVNKICIATDQVNITFNESPELIDVDKICVDINLFTYRVEAKISGGKGPYTLIQGPGSVVNNLFISDTLQSLDSFQILVQDANGCLSEIYLGTHNCNCGIIDACFLDTIPVKICQDKCIQLKSLCQPIIDPLEDGVMYVLHSGNNVLKTALEIFNDPNQMICFDTAAPKSMEVLKKYYITRVVGNDIAPKDNIIDSNDPCVRFSNPMEIIWNPYPNPDAGPIDTVCGLTYRFQGNNSLGTVMWNLVNGPGNANFKNPADRNDSVTVDVYGSYTFEFTEDFESCITSDVVTITFINSPEFIDNTLQFECDSVAENFRFSIDIQLGHQPTWSVLANIISGGRLTGLFTDADTWKSSWIPTGSSIYAEVSDRFNCWIDPLSISHICQCITDIGDMDLTPIILCADGTATAKYNPNTGIKDANDILKYVLYDGISSDPKSGNILALNDSGIFLFDPSKMTLGKTYFIAAFLGNFDPVTGNVNLQDRCMQVTPGVQVTWYAYPQAQIGGLNLLTCSVTQITLVSNNSISGSGKINDYLWSSVDGQFVNANSVNNSSVQINKPGTYNLFIRDSISGCTNETPFKVNQDIEKPIVQIQSPEILTCERIKVDLNGANSSNGAKFTATWKGNHRIDNGNSYISTVYDTGKYYLIVKNNFNDCLDSSLIEVKEDKIPPIADIQKRGDLTCTVNEIPLDGSLSKSFSGSISPYNWTSRNGNILSGLGSNQIKIGKPGGTFVLQVRDDKNGCLDYDTIQVLEIGNPLAIIEGLPQNIRCYSERNGGIQITQVKDYNNVGLSNLQYSINGSPFTSAPNFPNLAKGTYKITVRDKDGCLKDTSFVLVEPGPLKMKVTQSIVVDQGTLIDLDSLIREISGGTFPISDTTWFNTTLNQNWDANIRYIADSALEFIVKVTDIRGCITEERVRVLVRVIKDVWWPNVFSPNGDQINDTWNLYGKKVRAIRLLQIYDRWGDQVYTGQDLPPGTSQGQGWNGIFRNERALPAVYTFYAEIQFEGSANFDKFKGEFTLLR
ncbi:MAG: gliding motility-associated C-terminal domain-containing protein [Bacteroidota bacterium]|nr:gliding motility-associated C-terminal domain-containing protein [Bacteroidota bacterium]